MRLLFSYTNKIIEKKRKKETKEKRNKIVGFLCCCCCCCCCADIVRAPARRGGEITTPSCSLPHMHAKKLLIR